MTTVSWLGCNVVTGQIIEQLPEIVPSGSLSHLLSAYTSTAFRLPIPLGGQGAPPRNWEAATEAGRTMVIAVVNDQPVWAGLVLTRNSGTAATDELGCVSLEGYLDRRYVGTHTWTEQDQTSVIATGLIGDANTTEGIGFTVDAPASGVTRTRAYKDQDDKTVYAALQELSGVIAGPEWTVVLDWTDATQTAVKKTLRVRQRIGFLAEPPSPTRPTGNASAVFTSTGESDSRYKFSEDFTSSKGANHIVATSSGEGDTRPQSSPARDTALLGIGWPRYEHRFTPSESISDIATLDSHAAKALTLMSRGARLLKLTARADAYPRLGVDWNTGDDIGFELTGHRHPTGLTGVGRAIGWEFHPRSGVVEPILLLPGTP